MHAWEAIQKTLNHIEDHIGEETQIEELAEIALLSPFYYQRLFTRLVKKPVREYIKLRRLARACCVLRNKENRILDIAVEHGFCSHETFTRSFKATYGITPAQYRETPVGLDHFDKPDLLLNYVMIDEGVPLVSDGLVLEMNRKTLEQPISFLGKKGCYPFMHGKMLGERPGVSPSVEIWNGFIQALHEIPHISGGRKIGVCYKGDAPVGNTTYFAGVEVESSSESPRFASWQLPAREYVVCGFEAEDVEQLAPAALGKAMKYTRLWLKKHGLIADGFFPELYYPSSPDTAYMELWIPFKERD
ncbi:helix-turn-helix domain-containing protein [Gorillibacterium sp. CAU 1737]|uniref:AraC family transcriptional regulator n=1 Tax=Gorillibacterium sp. CAU 1737 TaxID=3140362 RepID=UPI003260B4E2